MNLGSLAERFAKLERDDHTRYTLVSAMLSADVPSICDQCPCRVMVTVRPDNRLALAREVSGAGACGEGSPPAGRAVPSWSWSAKDRVGVGFQAAVECAN